MLNLPYEDKQLLPTELSARAGSKRTLWTFKRDPPSSKGGEQRQLPRLPDDLKAKAQVKPGESAQEHKNKLQGTWRMVTAESDGFRNGEGRPELKDNRLVIEKSSFTLFYARNFELNGNTLELQKAEINTSVGDFTLDTTQTPPVIVLAWKDWPLNEKRDFTQKAIYALDGDTLRLCLSGVDEGKKAPTEFSGTAGSKQCLWTFRRDPVSEKRGEKKP